MITGSSTGETVLVHLIQFFSCQSEAKAVQAAEILKQAACEFVTIEFDENNETYYLRLFVAPQHVLDAQSPNFRGLIDTALRALAEDDCLINTRIDIRAWLPDEQASIGLNNCFFKKEATFAHDNLRFRSQGEVVIYEELKQRNVLFFPNPAAVLGTTGADYGEEVEKKEPDFLICCNGKWGILEINGDDFHSGIVKTTKDHERARRFNHYGLYFIQAYNLDKCKNDPVGVVDEFLKLLANHKA